MESYNSGHLQTKARYPNCTINELNHCWQVDWTSTLATYTSRSQVHAIGILFNCHSFAKIVSLCYSTPIAHTHTDNLNLSRTILLLVNVHSAMLACTNMGLRPFQPWKGRTHRQQPKRSIYIFLLYILGYLIRHSFVPTEDIFNRQRIFRPKKVTDNQGSRTTVLFFPSTSLLHPVGEKHTVNTMSYYPTINASNKPLCYSHSVNLRSNNGHHPTVRSTILPCTSYYNIVWTQYSSPNHKIPSDVNFF